jgi:hypothetical protein
MTEELTQNAKRRIELARELQRTQCYCGAKKRAKQTFCRREYFALPVAMRSALYQGIFDGYVEAYDAARKYLEER